MRVRRLFLPALLLALPIAAQERSGAPLATATVPDGSVVVRCPTCVGEETNKPDAVAPAPEAPAPLAASGASRTLFVPVILSAAGAVGSYYTSELTFTNKGSTNATLELGYTSAAGGGDGTVPDALPAGRQKIVPDAIAYLRSLGLNGIPSDGAVGTLRVRFSGLAAPTDGVVSVRTTTRVPEGRAGLAYPGADAALISAGAVLPDGGALSSGTFKPTNVGGGDSFPSPAPTPGSATALSTFNGTNPNGTWSLWVVDDTSGDSGSLSGGWCVNIATTAQTTLQPFCTSQSVSIPTSGAATPYPSTVSVSGLAGDVTRVTVSLKGFSHTFPSDVDMLLSGPAGQNLVIFSDVGSGTDANGLNFTLDDAPPLAFWLCGLRQNATDRSNVAVTNPGEPGDPSVTLRVSAWSGGTLARTFDDVTLAPGGFKQYSGILGDAGLANGYVKVERVAGAGRLLAYGVVNDQGNSDGSFVPAMDDGANAGKSSLVLPVIVEAGSFTSELVLTNVGTSSRSLTLTYVADALGGGTASLPLTLAAGEQRVIPSFVQYLRDQHVSGVPAAGTTLAGALFVSVSSGDLSNVFVGARTSAAGTTGRYGLFYTAVPAGSGFSGKAWLYGLQQNGENRTNLAIVNTGEKDSTTDVFTIDFFDGETGNAAGSVTGQSVGPKKWLQIGSVLTQGTAGLANAYARITRTSGSNPFLVYAVVNDGGGPGQRSGDGAYVLPALDCTYSVSGTSKTFGWSGGSSSTTLTATAGCPWNVTTDASWISLTSGSGGTGDATVSYAVASNAAASQRSGTLNIAGKTYTVTQLGNAPGPYDGHWSGTTSQSRPISFTVSKNEVTAYGMGISVSLGACSVSGTFPEVEFTPHPAVVGNKFDFSALIAASGGYFSLSVSGTFGSTTSASGSASVPLIVTGGYLCIGFGSGPTWTATRN